MAKHWPGCAWGANHLEGVEGQSSRRMWCGKNPSATSQSGEPRTEASRVILEKVRTAARRTSSTRNRAAAAGNQQHRREPTRSSPFHSRCTEHAREQRRASKTSRHQRRRSSRAAASSRNAGLHGRRARARAKRSTEKDPSAAGRQEQVSTAASPTCSRPRGGHCAR